MVLLSFGSEASKQGWISLFPFWLYLYIVIGISFPHTPIHIQEECGLVFVLLQLHSILELELRREDRIFSFLLSWNLEPVDVRIVNWLILRWIAISK
jgi:hypothetical protein